MLLAAALCPTEALSLREDEDADRLIFDATACLACGDCLAAGGLRLQEASAAVGEAYAGPRILIERAMAACPQCLRRHAPRAGQRVCDACMKDSDLAALGHGLMRRRQVPYGA
jgi:ferredoxin